MAAEAKYTLQIPVRDNLGNELGQISRAAHEWLYRHTGVKGSQIHGPVRGHWQNDEPEEFELLVTFAPDTPENDSLIKQLGVHIAEAANQWGVFVTKESKGGPQSWTVNNPNYVEGQPAPLASGGNIGDQQVSFRPTQYPATPRV